MEQSLEAAGVTPRVLSTPDSILGSPPLSQGRMHGGKAARRLPGHQDQEHARRTRCLPRVSRCAAGPDHRGARFYRLWLAGRLGHGIASSLRATQKPPLHDHWADVVLPGEHASNLIELHEGDFIQIKGADDFFTGLVDQLNELGGTGDPEATPWEVPARPKHNLPVQLTSFIGREDEFAEMKNLVSRRPLDQDPGYQPGAARDRRRGCSPDATIVTAGLA